MLLMITPGWYLAFPTTRLVPCSFYHQAGTLLFLPPGWYLALSTTRLVPCSSYHQAGTLLFLHPALGDVHCTVVVNIIKVVSCHYPASRCQCVHIIISHYHYTTPSDNYVHFLVILLCGNVLSEQSKTLLPSYRFQI